MTWHNGPETIDVFEAQQSRIWEGIGHHAPPELARVIEYARALFELHPFGVGDHVELIDPPVINEKLAPGWMGQRHLFVAGARGTVVSLEYLDGYRVGFQFDVETFIHPHTKRPEPVLRKAVYGLGAALLRRVTQQNGDR